MPLVVISKCECSLCNDTPVIPVRELGIGQVARVVQNPENAETVGKIIKRDTIGMSGITHDDSWGAVPRDDDFRVKPLSNGTRFVLVENE